MITPTNNIIKSVERLDERKWRRRDGLFKAEGTKCVLDTLPHFTLDTLYATRPWLDSHEVVVEPDRICETTPGEMRRMSSLTTPPQVIAVYRIPEWTLSPEALRHELVVALDTVQDPGNLGTIIRVADWFGVRNIICSRETADCFAPKVIQATMGSISRVRLHYCDLPETIAAIGAEQVYGTFLDGVTIGDAPLSTEGIIVMGNEGNGVSPEVSRCVTRRLFIPSYPPGEETGESLNVAIATAITLAKFRGV